MASEVIETVLPLLEEVVRVSKRLRRTGSVQIAVETEAVTSEIVEELSSRIVDVERIVINREIASSPGVRTEGDTIIIPVVEEVVVVERRLMLREEVRVRLVTRKRIEAQSVTLLSQSAVVTRRPSSQPSSETTIMSRIVTGLFDSRPEAERVVEHLVQHLGVDRQAVQIHAAGSENAVSHGAPPAAEKGFFASLSDLFLPDDDRATYAEGLRRGHIVVSARVPDDQIDRVMEAFESNGAVDLDDRETTWRREGWTGATATASTGAAATGGMASARTELGAADTEERIALVEEQIRVGKREVGHGRVRVRSYVVETPVHEQITLREENVSIERRPVDRPLTAVDEAAFRERTIEAVESAEEAIVSKEARVREELVIRKTAEERVETISDTVRRTEVEIDDDRATRTGTTTTGTTPLPTTPRR